MQKKEYSVRLYARRQKALLGLNQAADLAGGYDLENYFVRIQAGKNICLSCLYIYFSKAKKQIQLYENH